MVGCFQLSRGTSTRKCFEGHNLAIEVKSVAADIIYEHPIGPDRGAAGLHYDDLTGWRSQCARHLLASRLHCLWDKTTGIWATWD